MRSDMTAGGAESSAGCLFRLEMSGVVAEVATKWGLEGNGTAGYCESHSLRS